MSNFRANKRPIYKEIIKRVIKQKNQQKQVNC